MRGWFGQTNLRHSQGASPRPFRRRAPSRVSRRLFWGVESTNWGQICKSTGKSRMLTGGIERVRKARAQEQKLGSRPCMYVLTCSWCLVRMVCTRALSSNQFDAVRGSFVCSMEDEDDMVTDYRFAMLPVFR